MVDIDPRAKLSQELYREWRDSRRDWDNEARTDIDFFYGNHYTREEADEMASRNQAAVPMDRVAPAIDKLKAMLTSRTPVFTVIPREDSDTQISKIWRTILITISGIVLICFALLRRFILCQDRE